MDINIGENIRKLRSKNGFSLEKLAEKSAISSNHLGLIERGVKTPRLDTIEKIATALHITIIDIICDSSIDTKNVNIQKILILIKNMNSKELDSVYSIIKELKNWKNL